MPHEYRHRRACLQRWWERCDIATLAGVPPRHVIGFATMARPGVLPRQPRLPSRLEQQEAPALADDATYSDAIFSDVVWSHQHAEGVHLETVRLVNGNLSGAQLANLRISDTELIGCEMANLLARRAEATRVIVDASRVTGIGLQESFLRDVVFRGCRVDLASFGFAKLVCVAFEDCLLAETSFLDCHLERVRFSGCDLNCGDFRGASLQACEFWRCDLTNLEGVAHLSGAAIDRPGIVANADVWAAALGITVLDDDI